MLAAFENTDRNTNAVEGYFGHIKFYDALFHCGSHNSNAVVAATRDELFDHISSQYIAKSGRARDDVGPSMLKKRRAQADHEGRIDELDVAVMDAVMELARSGGAQYRADAVADAADADAAAVQREKEKIEAALQNQVKAYVRAHDKIAFTPIIADAVIMRSSLPTLTRQLDAFLAGKTIAAQTRSLTGTIQRYVDGMGYSHLAPKSYSSTVVASIGAAGTTENVAFLRGTLLSALSSIKTSKLTLTTEPVVPALHRRPLAKLGVATQQREALESEQFRSADELHAAAEAYRSRPRKQLLASVRRSSLPTIDCSLIEKRVEVMYEMEYNRRGGGSYVVNQWCAGTIKDVSTTTSVDTSAGKRRKLGLGHIWIEFDDNTGGWLLASRPTFFRGNKPGAWRFEEDADADMDEDDEGNESDGVDDDGLVDASSDDDDDDDDL